MTHTLDSIMALAYKWTEGYGDDDQNALRLALREVLAERDELQRDRDCLKRLYDAKKPLHERRTMPSPAFPDDPECQPPYMFQASFWTSGCRCVECHALHVGEQQYVRAEKAEAECERLRKDAVMLRKQLLNFAQARRFDKTEFANDTEFADWVQSRSRHEHHRSSIDAAIAQERT